MEKKMRSSNEIFSLIKTGWNIGNSLDSIGSNETAWGNRFVTKDIVDSIKSLGFNLLRIPTTWRSHMGKSPDYILDNDWLDRVEEVVNYGLLNNMFVIINTHHETSWLIPNDENIEEVNKKFIRVWEQISERFKDYDDRLMFEGMNEPRIIGGQDEWGGSTQEVRNALNILNRSFIDTVRKSSGNNSKRTLLTTTPAAATYDLAFEGLNIYNEENIVMSLHSYSPVAFTMSGVMKEELFHFDDTVKFKIDRCFNRIKKFIPEGMHVILTEYGSTLKTLPDGTTNLKDNIEWFDYFLSTARKNNIKCVLWDNNNFGEMGERFGFFNRETLKWEFPEILEKIMKNT